VGGIRLRGVAATARQVTRTVAPILVGSIALSGQSAIGRNAAVDAVFAKWTASTPGCAVGVSENGEPVLAQAYGMADLEHDVKNTPDTIFEAGSVTKQFTAAAVLLLAHDGTIGLDEPARKYIPELPPPPPGASTPGSGVAPPKPQAAKAGGSGDITIRHMLTHTSGLRDWGSIESIAGWPRTSRVYTHAHVLDIVSRQRALNFPPGTRWSYCNTGYNLAAIIVSRVSGMTFADFTQQRIFEPLGMTHTSWRDDHTRIVKNRAIAYADGKDGFHTEMPFEDVYGNSSLLTTVGDLLKWNENFTSLKVGDAAFVADQQTPQRFHDGRQHNYAFGLTVGTYRGVREIGHSGSTAGYRAHLTRFPDQRVSVAVLCNVSSGSATQYAHAVSDIYLKDRVIKSQPAEPVTLTSAELDAVPGLYRNRTTGAATVIVRGTDGLRLERGARLVPASARRFAAAGQTWDFDGRGGARVTADALGTSDTFERMPPAKPTPAQLQELVGSYRSDDAETTMVVAVQEGGLVLKRRPDTVISLTPT
jgi:CubicO group peptidase (beta-lactamase class C family)